MHLFGVAQPGIYAFKSELASILSFAKIRADTAIPQIRNSTSRRSGTLSFGSVVEREFPGILAGAEEVNAYLDLRDRLAPAFPTPSAAHAAIPHSSLSAPQGSALFCSAAVSNKRRLDRHAGPSPSGGPQQLLEHGAAPLSIDSPVDFAGARSTNK
jgi:hypothetical protein